MKEQFTVKPYSTWTALSGFYVYGYLREEDDEFGPKGSLRYIGEGKGRRLVMPHGVRVPSSEFIVIFTDDITKKESILMEEQLISHYGRIINGTGILENIKPKAGGTTIGKASVRDTVTGETKLVLLDDSDYLSGKLVPVLTGVNKGKATVVDTRTGKTCQVSVDDPEYAAGVYVSIMKGFAVVRDETGKTMRVSVNHPDYLSGKFTNVGSDGFSKNEISVKDTVTGETKRVSVDHPDYLSGKLVGITKGMVTAKNPITGERYRVSVNDPDYLSGKLVNVNKKIIQ